MRCDLLNELPHFELIIACLCCHFGEWMKAGPTRSDLSCPLSDEVRLCSLVIYTLQTVSNMLLFGCYSVYWIHV